MGITDSCKQESENYTNDFSRTKTVNFGQGNGHLIMLRCFSESVSMRCTHFANKSDDLIEF